jgi:hypothetical protein
VNATGSAATWRLPLLFGLLIGIAAGYGVGRLATVHPPAIDSTTLSVPAASQTDAERAQQQQELLALGYASGTEPAPAVTGVTAYVKGSTYDAYNVYTSGDRPGAYLMSMDGEIIHEWSKSFHDLWPGTDPGEQNINYWRRVHVFDNGDVLAIIEPHGIFRLDKDSNVLWENRCGAHHDLVVAPNGHIFVLARDEQMVDLADGHGLRPILEDYVVELDESGRELRRVSLIRALKQSRFAPLLQAPAPHWDILHTNSLKRIPDDFSGGLPAFQPGRFAVSLRTNSTIAVLDYVSEQIVWALNGQWQFQHEFTILDSGNIMLFDNEGNNGRSKVIELNPATQQIEWSYGMNSKESLDSPLCGIAERLPNGNTLITEAVPGRVIEVTPSGDIVWEFFNPSRLGDNPEIIASLMDFKRLPESYDPAWLNPGARERFE